MIIKWAWKRKDILCNWQRLKALSSLVMGIVVQPIPASLPALQFQAPDFTAEQMFEGFV